jgi:hypothetical protein
LSALSRFEELVERLVEGSLVGLLGAPVQPVEIAKRLTRALENERQVGVGRAIAPNRFTVRLNTDDFARFAPAQSALERELADYLQHAAAERQLSFLVPPSVRLEASSSTGRHQMGVSAEFADAPKPPPAPEPVSAEHTQRFQAVAPPPPRTVSSTECALALPGGPTVPLRKDHVTVGRALDNDVVVEDSRVSRYHAELRRLPSGWTIRDRRSTNGSFLNGRPIQPTEPSPLALGDVVSLGGVEILVVARPIASEEKRRVG